MTSGARRYAKSQDGFTLVEVIITLAISSFVMVALTSVILTSVRAASVATGRVEASSQVRSFQYVAYDDFARSNVVGLTGCTASPPCTTQPIVLSGFKADNSPYQVTYAWDGSDFLDRTDSNSTKHAATSVTSFSWYVDTTTKGFQTVVIQMTVTVQAYSESQTFLFYPRVNP